MDKHRPEIENLVEDWEQEYPQQSLNDVPSEYGDVRRWPADLQEQWERGPHQLVCADCGFPLSNCGGQH